MQAEVAKRGKSGVSIRDTDIADRLDWAAEQHTNCPAKNYGRLKWVHEELAKKGITVSQETVRKWLSGENRPRLEKVTALAEIFGVDASWLEFGVDANYSPREQKAREAIVDGTVNLVAGLIQMDGGFPAFPEENDVRAAKEHIDLYAIIKGAQYAFHVALGDEVDGNYHFGVPARNDNVILLGVIRDGFAMKVYEISPDILDAYGSRRSASIQIKVAPNELKQITSFSTRL